MIKRLYFFFDLIIKKNIIFREMPTDESETIKEQYFKKLYAILTEIYNNYQISDINLKQKVLLYLDNIAEEKISMFRYNLSDIITYSEDAIIDEDLYIKNDEFRKLYFNLIRAFRYLMLSIDENKTKRLREDLVKLETLSNNIKESYNGLEHDASQLYKVIENIEKIANNILPQAITVLGIFVAILVVYLGAK